MKMQKCAEKFFAVCLCVCLIMSFAVSANAAECELRLSDAKGYAGTERTLTLSVKNNPGISNGILFVRSDPEIFSENENDISVGNIGSKFEIIEKDCKQGVVTLGFVSGKNVTEDGVLFTIPVTVALDAYPTQIKIDIEVKELVGTDDVPIATRNTASDFTVSEPPQCIPGDVNGDGSTDISDAMLVFYHVARKKLLPNEKLFAANVDKNKEVDIADAMQIFYFVAKKITELPT